MWNTNCLSSSRINNFICHLLHYLIQLNWRLKYTWKFTLSDPLAQQVGCKSSIIWRVEQNPLFFSSAFVFVFILFVNLDTCVNKGIKETKNGGKKLDLFSTASFSLSKLSIRHGRNYKQNCSCKCFLFSPFVLALLLDWKCFCKLHHTLCPWATVSQWKGELKFSSASTTYSFSVIFG